MYHTWSVATAKWVSSRSRPDEPVFLAIDAERLAEIAEMASICESSSAQRSFIDAVRSECAARGVIRVEHLRGTADDGIPKGCGFLAFLVLAANERGEEGDDQFYTSISRLLWPDRGLRHATRQDIGMPPGGSCEEPLWIEWNTWLLQQGFAPTARRGQGPRNKFRMYPISQSTLSFNEKKYLAREIFAPALNNGSLSRHLDPAGVESWLRRRAASGTPRIWASVHDRIIGRDRAGGHRFPGVFREAFLTDCYSIYEAVAIDPAEPSHIHRGGRPRARPVLVAGLLRLTELDGAIHYRLRPRRPRTNVDYRSGSLLVNGQEYALRDGGDPAWLEVVGPALLDLTPRSFRLQGVPGLDSLDLPERALWILAPDAHVPTDELLVSDRKPDPDEMFLVLTMKGGANAHAVRSSLVRCKELGLLDWATEVPVGEGWIEYRRCRVLLSPWQATPPVGIDPDVYARLSPEANDRIRLEGGLRDPSRRGAFMESALPGVAVVTESDPVKVRLCLLASPSDVIFEGVVKRRSAVELPAELPPGEYLLFAIAVDGREERELDSRRFLVTSWSQLQFDRLATAPTEVLGLSPCSKLLAAPSSGVTP